MQTQSEFENSILENSGVGEHSHTGVLSDSVRDKVCSRCVPCPFPPITADPTSQDTQVDHVELSRVRTKEDEGLPWWHSGKESACK